VTLAEFFTDERRWLRGRLSEHIQDGTNPKTLHAACILGAKIEIYGMVPAIAAPKGYSSWTVWNDAPHRTFAEVQEAAAMLDARINEMKRGRP